MLDELGELSTFKEMKQAINPSMERRKSPGTNSIPAELFQKTNDKNELMVSCRMLSQTGLQFPEEKRMHWAKKLIRYVCTCNIQCKWSVVL
jgi:hypothetical protein